MVKLFSKKGLKVVCVVPDNDLKDQLIEMLGRVSFGCEIYTVLEFYLHLPKCDILIIDEVHYLFYVEIYAPISLSLFNGVWNLSQYKRVFGFSATADEYLIDIIKGIITEDVQLLELHSEFQQLTGFSQLDSHFYPVAEGKVFDSVCARTAELYATTPMVVVVRDGE